MTPSLRKELWRTPDLLGFAAHWTWIWCVFWSSLFYAEGTLLNSSESAGAAAGLSTIALEPLWVTSLLANVVTIAFLLLLSYLRNPLSDVRCLPVLAAALTALGTLAISHPSLVMTGGGASTVYLAGSLLTGVGSGIVINGQLVYGHDGFAGELGHVIVRRENGRMCGCGRKGCLETYCSATGVARTAREFLTARTEPSLLRSIPAENITSKDVYDAAVKGDKLAQDIFNFTGEILGEALADAIAFSSPEAIVLFGGLAKSGDYIFKPIQASIDKNVLNIYKGKTKLLMSELKDADAAVLGASALGWELK